MEWALARKLARTERAQFAVDFLDIEQATDISGAQWEPFQIDFLNDEGTFRHDRKARQIGYSWLIGLESTIGSILEARSTSLFVSINREESAEKIRYARMCWEALHPSARAGLSLTQDNILGLGWSNDSRILSMPQRPPRGKAKAKLYLDEFAHYRLDREIYQAALFTTNRGGRVRIGSTTMGAQGMFWEIGEQRVRKYPGYTRAVTPWFAVQSLLRPGLSLRKVTRECWLLGDTPGASEERVRRFGNERMVELFDNTPLDDWQQEMECAYIDEALAFIPWGDIMAAVVPASGDGWVETAGGLVIPDYLAPWWVTKRPETALEAIYQMQGAVAVGIIKGPLTWGMDVGRRKDLSVLTVIERDEGRNRHIVRAVMSLDRIPFEMQEHIAHELLDRLPIVRGFIDTNGIGAALAEHLFIREGQGERAVPMVFSQPSKAEMATHLKLRFQKHRGPGGISIADDRDLKYQIHSIRRRVTANNNVVYDVSANEKHHADMFWSLALANEAAERLERVSAFPVAGSITLTTKQSLNSMVPTTERSVESDLGDEHGLGLTIEQFNALIEGGLAALHIALQGTYAGAAHIVEADPEDLFDDFGDDGKPEEEKAHVRPTPEAANAEHRW